MTDLTRRTANVLTQTCGLQEGDYLALILPRVPEWWLVAVGCIRTGIIFMPGTTQMKAKDIVYRLQASKAKGIVTTDTLAPVVDSLASEYPGLKTKLLVSDQSCKGWLDFRSLIKSASPDHVCIKSKTLDPMAVFFTSGTSGLPKMTKHSHGLALRSFLPSCLRFPTLEHCCAGGEALLPEEQEQWRKQTGILLYQAYGQSETGVTCGIFRGMKIKPGSMGKAIPPFDIQIIDDKGNILPPDTEGILGIRIKPVKPLGLFMCYENDPVKTEEVECGDFYNTGDRATVDTDGYFFFLGRADDIINASGYRIGPSEVENALAEHPAVAESAVVSSPDPIRGEVVKAFIVLTPKFLSHDRDQLTKELQQHVKSVTAPYKYPRKIVHVLSGFLHLEPDVYGILQKFTNSIAVLSDFFHLRPDVYGILHKFTGITDILPDFFHLGPDVYGILHKFTSVIDILPDFLHLRPDVYGIPWKFTVNVQQIPEKTDNIKEKIKEHSENMSISKQKTVESKKQGQKTTRHNKMLSDEALKGNIKTIEKANKHSNGVPESTPATPPSVRGQNVKNPKAVKTALSEASVGGVKVKSGDVNVHKGNVQFNVKRQQSQDANAKFEDSELSTSLKRRNLEDKNKKLKDSCDALRAEKVMKEAELKMLKENIDNLVGVYEQRKMAAEEKLKIKKHNLMEKEIELSAMKENLKLVSEETLKYKQQKDQIQEQLQQAENVYRFQICVCENKAQDNWIKSRILERELEKQRREAAYWKYRFKLLPKSQWASAFSPLPLVVPTKAISA
ncbi:hypothetical protein CB1_000307022 [Camelus ferus]|nr:hypothetical protein CB1_000307022 [Camelus ferus]